MFKKIITAAGFFLAASVPALAGTASTAVEATVLTVAEAARVPQADTAFAVPDRDNSRTLAGGALGSLAGAVLARNSGNGNGYAAMAGLAAVGAALGHFADRRADRRRAEPEGFQVILRLDTGETRAVFMPAPLDPHIQPRSRVWLIGDSTIIPNQGG